MNFGIVTAAEFYVSAMVTLVLLQHGESLTSKRIIAETGSITLSKTLPSG